MTGDRPTRLDRRLLRALELRAADATWAEIARTPLTPQDPTRVEEHRNDGQR